MARGKKEIRRDMLARRRTLAPSDALDMSWAAQGQVLGLPLWQTAKEVLLYMPARGEVMTETLVGDALCRGLKVLLPRCRPNTPGEMDLAAIPHLGAVRLGAYDILEPDPAVCPAVTACKPDVAVLPGVAFDRRGFRLGYGGGYFDRLLGGKGTADVTKTLVIGLCFGFQVLEALPIDPWDKPVAAVVTEEAILWI